MAGVQVTIPGPANLIESRQALMDSAIRQQFSIFSTPVANAAPDPVAGSNGPPAFAPAPDPDPNAPPGSLRRPMAGDLGRPLMTTRLG